MLFTPPWATVISEVFFTARVAEARLGQACKHGGHVGHTYSRIPRSHHLGSRGPLGVLPHIGMSPEAPLTEQLNVLLAEKLNGC